MNLMGEETVVVKHKMISKGKSPPAGGFLVSEPGLMCGNKVYCQGELMNVRQAMGIWKHMMGGDMTAAGSG